MAPRNSMLFVVVGYCSTDTHRYTAHTRILRTSTRCPIHCMAGGSCHRFVSQYAVVDTETVGHCRPRISIVIHNIPSSIQKHTGTLYVACRKLKHHQTGLFRALQF